MLLKVTSENRITLPKLTEKWILPKYQKFGIFLPKKIFFAFFPAPAPPPPKKKHVPVAFTDVAQITIERLLAYTL